MWPFGKSTQDRIRDEFKQYQNLTSGVQVNMKGKTAVLSGTVPTDRAIDFVSGLAQGINGVESVDTSGLVSTQAEDTPVQEVQVSAENQSTAVSMPDVVPAVPEQTPSSGLVFEQETPTSSSPTATGGQVISNMQSASMMPPPSAQKPSSTQRAAPAQVPSALAKAAHRAISSNVELRDDPIDVLQRGSTLVLRGAVDSQHEYNLARQLAMVPGVTDVDSDELKIVQNVKQMAAERDDDQDAVYTVKSGDTLSEIALRYYGNANDYMKIARANGISDPDRIQVGQRLKIPGG